MRTGSRWVLLFVAGAACVPRTARAEDIGHDPLLPDHLPAEAPGKLPEPSRGAGDTDADLSLRGPSLSDRRPSSFDAGPPATQRRWYGWQTLLVDAVPVLGLSVAAGSPRGAQNTWIVGSSLTYFLGAPIVHSAHGQAGKAILSLGLRSLGPLLILVGTNQDAGNGSALEVLGVLAIPAAIAIDSAAIAREDVTPGAARAQGGPIVGFAPWLDARHGAGGISVSLGL